MYPGSEPTKDQLKFLKDIGLFNTRIIRAGNRCLAEGTLVATSAGPVEIQDIRPGDTVYSEHGKPVEVLEVYSNGPKEVYDIKDRQETLARCTKDHVWLTNYGEVALEDFTSGTKIRNCKNSSYTGIIISEYPKVLNTYDIHVKSETNLYCLANGLVTHNSGKGMTAARELAWILTDTHPYWQRPLEWGDGPIQVLVAGQTLTNMETEIWNKKLSPFLDLSEWRQVRQGQQLKAVRNKKTGDEIIFLSHADSSEKNRRAMQGYTAHYVWLDEMPGSIRILQEIMDRASTNGYFVATFTPKFKSEEIKHAIDAISEPHGRIYRFKRLDNPVFKDKKDEELAKLEGYSEAMKNAILFGEWYAGDESVYEWLPEFMEKEPEGYSPAWRHCLSVDPALRSKLGFTLWAEEPSTGTWYLVRDEYVEGMYDPEKMFAEVEKRINGYNVIRRVADPHEVWFISTASKHGKSYISPYDKNSRKNDLIKGLQAALSSGQIKIAPWCTTFKSEIQSCQWSETSDRIINASSFHTLDSAQYFVDCRPRYSTDVPSATWHEELRRGNHKRKQIEKTIKKVSKGGRVRPISMWGRRGNKKRKFG